jgi:acyl transferase domain-containing protein
VNDESSTLIAESKILAEPKVCFVFPGMGQQHPDMGRQLYREVPVFRDTLNRADKKYQELAGFSFLDKFQLFKGDVTPDKKILDDTHTTQMGITFLQLGLTATWQSWGIKPELIIGHSMGEIAAAHTCGNLTLEEAVFVAYYRSHAQGVLSGTGGMIVVGLPADKAENLLKRVRIDGKSKVWNAALNAPNTSVIAGNHYGLDQVAKEAKAAGIFATKLDVVVPFHTPLVDFHFGRNEKEDGTS